jgi:hypothetical protein
MMQALAGAYANGEDIGTGPDRGIISEAAALDAVMQVFALIDSQLEAGAMSRERALHGMLMLMGIREHIRSIPGPPGDEALYESDLADLAAMLRELSLDP